MRARHPILWPAVGALAICLFVSPGAVAGPPGGYDGPILRAYGLSTEPGEVLRCVQSRLPSELTPAEVAAAVQQLGDNAFPVREAASRKLRACGPSVLPALAAATKSPDPEVARRVAAVSAETTRAWAPDRVAPFRAAVRVLLDARPSGFEKVVLRATPTRNWDVLADGTWAAAW